MKGNRFVNKKNRIIESMLYDARGINRWRYDMVFYQGHNKGEYIQPVVP